MGREHEEADAPFGTRLLELGLDFTPPVDLDGFHRERHAPDQLPEKPLRRAGRCPAVSFQHVPAGDDVYDDAGRLEVVTDWDSLVSTYTYDRGGRPETVFRPNGLVTSHSFDDAGRLRGLTHTRNGVTFATYDCSHDDVGNRVTAHEWVRQPLAVATPDAIFANGFESGGLTGWSSSSTGSGTLTVTTPAALAGTYGMQALINSTTARYVQDTTPNSEPRYRVLFLFDPNSVTMAEGNAHYLFYGYTGTSTVGLRLELGYTAASGHWLQVSAVNNSTTWSYSGWANITDAPHVIELDWRSSTAGRVDWWIDGAMQTAVSGFDNSSRKID